MNLNKILASLSFIFFLNMFKKTLSINFKRAKNNMLRIYVFTSPRPIRKGLIKKINNFFHNTTEKVNIYLMYANASYYSLSEEERTIIETIISFSL
jgi:hypothetical protein